MGLLFFKESVNKTKPIFIIEKDRPPLISSNHDMVIAALTFLSFLSWHFYHPLLLYTYKDLVVKTKETSPCLGLQQVHCCQHTCNRHNDGVWQSQFHHFHVRQANQWSKCRGQQEQERRLTIWCSNGRDVCTHVD